MGNIFIALMAYLMELAVSFYLWRFNRTCTEPRGDGATIFLDMESVQSRSIKFKVIRKKLSKSKNGVILVQK